MEQSYLEWTRHDLSKEDILKELPLLENVRFPRLNHRNTRKIYTLAAIMNNDLDNFIYALLKGHDFLFEKNSHGEFIINLAAKHNSFHIIRYVAKTLDLNKFQTAIINDSMLIRAIDHGHDELAKQIIEWGFKINHLIDGKKTHLHALAAMPNHPTNMLRLQKLVSLGADINLPDVNGNTPVFIAGKINNIAVMKFFLEQKCETTFSSPLSRNLLTVCMSESSLDTVEFLLQQGFDPYLFIDKYFTNEFVVPDVMPIIAAVTRGDKKFLDLILKYKFTLYQHPTISWHLLLAAWHYNINIDMAYYLVKRGVSVKDFAEYVNSQHNTMPLDTTKLIREFLLKVGEWEAASHYYLEHRDDVLEFAKNYNLKISAMEIPDFINFMRKYRDSRNQQCAKEKEEYYAYRKKIVFLTLWIFGLFTTLTSIAFQIFIPLYKHYWHTRQEMKRNKQEKENEKEISKKSSAKEKNIDNENQKPIKTINLKLVPTPESILSDKV